MDEAVVPVPAASLLIIRDDPFEVLVVQRNSRGTFPGATVFPGGVVEPSDSAQTWDGLTTGGADLSAADRALRIAGVRETWEEAGLLLAGTAGSGVSPAQSSSPSFAEMVTSRSGRLHLGEVHPFSNWITPPMLPRRWDTHFYLVVAPRDEQEARSDGAETVALNWMEPGRLVEDAESGRHPLMFPTLSNLRRLAESGNTASAIAAAAQAPYVPITTDVVRDGAGVHLRIPEGAGFRVTVHEEVVELDIFGRQAPRP